MFRAFRKLELILSRSLLPAGIAAAAGMLIGLWPALRISRIGSLSLELHQGAGRAASEGTESTTHPGRSRCRTNGARINLVSRSRADIESFWRAQNAPLGFDPHAVLTMNLSLPKARYPTDESVAAFNAQFSNASARFLASPPPPLARTFLSMTLNGTATSTLPARRNPNTGRHPAPKSTSFRRIISAS